MSFVLVQSILFVFAICATSTNIRERPSLAVLHVDQEQGHVDGAENGGRGRPFRCVVSTCTLSPADAPLDIPVGPIPLKTPSQIEKTQE